MSNDIYFDNFIITDNKDTADTFAADSWEIKHTQEKASAGAVRTSTYSHLLISVSTISCRPEILQCSIPGLEEANSLVKN